MCPFGVGHGGILDQDAEVAAVGHGVTGIDGEIQQCALDFPWVGHDIPEFALGYDVNIHGLAQAAF